MIFVSFIPNIQINPILISFHFNYIPTQFLRSISLEEPDTNLDKTQYQ